MALVGLACLIQRQLARSEDFVSGLEWLLQPTSVLHRLANHGAVAQVVARTSAASGATSRRFRIGESRAHCYPSAWAFRDELSSLACFSEDYEDAWRSVTRTFLWDWLPTESESADVLNILGLLTGDLLQDFKHAWEGYEDTLGTHPLLLVQLAARGVGRSISRII